MNPTVVVLESPLSGNFDQNIAYAQRSMVDSRLRGEIPLVSHLLWTQHHLCPQHFVEDIDEKYFVVGREKSLEDIKTLRRMTGKVIFYLDYGWSSGMKAGLEHCQKENIPYETRTLGNLYLDVENSKRRKCSPSPSRTRKRVKSHDLSTTDGFNNAVTDALHETFAAPPIVKKFPSQKNFPTFSCK